MTKKSLIIIPTFNEKENIHVITERIFSSLPETDILVVDDNSPDGTGKIADDMAKLNSSIHVLHREGKLGLGTAYIAGFQYAIEHQYDYVFEMDADLSHDPKELPNFITALQENDLVLGSRYISGVNVINWPLRRLILSYGANMYTRFITGMPVKDATGGFKAFRIEVLKGINLDKVESNGYSFQIELTYKAFVAGYKIKEIPIIFVDRVEGQSKMSSSIVREAILMVWVLKFRKIFGLLN
jgi:dolichol-phosphate mannosyltransferase